jgi:glycosyltransferase involved in cell wall biosynthesis
MNVLWLRPKKPDNISIHSERLALKLQDRGHEVGIRDASVFDLLSPVSDEISPDIIIGTTRLGAFIGALEKRRRRIPLVVEHVDPIYQMKERSGFLKYFAAAWTERFAFRTADHVIVIYESEVPRVTKYNEKYTQASLGVEYDMFASPSRKTVEKATTTISDKGFLDEKILIYVGGLEPTYNISEMVESMDYIDDEWVLLILGDGSLKEYVESVDENRQDVCYLGTVPHEMVPGFMHKSDVGICLVDDENTLKVLEYAAAGLPSVNLKGKAEDRFEDLVYFSGPDPKEIADTVTEAHQEGAKDGFRELAREHGWESIADEYEEAMEKTLDERD